jgi:hypothetical protein
VDNEMETREQLQDIQRQCLIISANIYDMTKELEAMNKTASEIKRKITEALDKSKHED